MKRQKLLEVWYDRQILPGMKWEHEIDKNLTSAHIILLLVSAPFLNSDYCYGIEMQKALQRNAEGTARVIPVLLRPVDWEDAPFSNLQILPTGAKPVTRWTNKDDAFEDVAKELRRVVKDLRFVLRTPEEWFKEGYKLYELKHYEEALFAFNEAIRLNLSSAVAYIGKGAALSELKRYEEALVALDEAIRLAPNDAIVYNYRGEALFGLKRYKEALATLNQAIQLAPSIPINHYAKGVVLQSMGREDEAQAAFKKAQELGYTG